MNFFCPRWGFENIPWPVFLERVKTAGYDGIEWFPFGEVCNYEEVLVLLKQYELDFSVVMAVIEPYTTFERYKEKLRIDLEQLMTVKNDQVSPLFFSAQIGREFFEEWQVEECLLICNLIEENFQTPIYQETHRNKWSYAAHVVAPILVKHPSLKLTFDVSHWFCVSESYLEDQQNAVNQAILHARHIHARVGSTQASQVWDPASAESEKALVAHLRIWDKWVAQMIVKGRPITITPEFGPAPYLIQGDRIGSLQEEQWRLNLWMKDFLKNRYR
ncbi:MAG: sugar phosphate isomerase/epimerase [Bacteroidia bacterium]